MKKKALIAAVLAATTLSVTTAFAAENPFKDLPQGHWAYDAVTMLAQDGVLDGYGDGKFNGDKLMNRYEMAEIVSKAVAKYDGARPQDKGAIKKLEKEFGTELQDMDVRLKGVEEDVKELKKNSTSFKWFGSSSMTYSSNTDQKMHDKSGTTKERHMTKEIHLGMYGEPAKNLSFSGDLQYKDKSLRHSGWGDSNNNQYDSNYDNQERFNLKAFALDWNHAGTKVSAGRTKISIGQGMIYWNNPVDGAYIQHDFSPKITLMAGVGDPSAEGWQAKNMPSVFGNLTIKASKATQITAGFFHNNTSLENQSVSYQEAGYITTDKTFVPDSAGANTWTGSDGKKHIWVNGADKVVDWHQDSKKTVSWSPDDYKMNQWSAGFNTQFAPKWNLMTEYVRNNAGVLVHKSGAIARLTYGNIDWHKGKTWHIMADYMAFGGGVLDSKYFPHRLDINGGTGAGDDFANDQGTRGWGLQYSYMLADNLNFTCFYYKMKPYDTNRAGYNHFDNIYSASFCYIF